MNTKWIPSAIQYITVMAVILIFFYLTNLREEAYENRAVNCRTLVALDVPLRADGTCYNPNVLKYYDSVAEPSAGYNSSGQKANRDGQAKIREMVCAILKNQNTEAKEKVVVPPDYCSP